MEVNFIYYVEHVHQEQWLWEYLWNHGHKLKNSPKITIRDAKIEKLGFPFTLNAKITSGWI
jgi:hypothetical protein